MKAAYPIHFVAEGGGVGIEGFFDRFGDLTAVGF
jgi:hypothetical protein